MKCIFPPFSEIMTQTNRPNDVPTVTDRTTNQLNDRTSKSPEHLLMLQILFLRHWSMWALISGPPSSPATPSPQIGHTDCLTLAAPGLSPASISGLDSKRPFPASGLEPEGPLPASSLDLLGPADSRFPTGDCGLGTACSKL